MGNEISRVYQFISEYGSIEEFKKQIDELGNKDGVVIKTEFCNFMFKNFEFANDENEKDLINKFWASIDTKLTGKIGATGLSNRNALDSEELALAEETLKATNKINEFISRLEKTPKGLEGDSLTRWKASIKESLLNKALDFFKHNPKAKTEDWDINSAYKTTCGKATADFVAQDTFKQELEKRFKLAEKDFCFNQDRTIQNIINSYIRSMNFDNSDKDVNEIMDEVVKKVNELVTEYVKTAEGSTSTDEIAKYGYSSVHLNDLQKTVLTKGIKEEVDKRLENEKNELYTNHKSELDAKLEEFIAKELNGKKATEFEGLKEKIVEKFFTNEIKELEDSITRAQEKSLKEFKAQAIKDVKVYYDQDKYKDAVNEVYKNDYEATINDCTSKGEIEELFKKLKEKVDEIDKNANADAAVKDTYKNLATLIGDIDDTSMTTGSATINTTFGFFLNNIFFVDQNTTDVYEKIKSTIKNQLQMKNMEAYGYIQGSIDKLIQTAWIMTYNNGFNTNEDHSSLSFISNVKNNLQKILNKLSTNPEYLEIFTSTTFKNANLTKDLKFYGKEDATDGNDNIWVYKGSNSISSDGSVSWDDKTDANEYYLEMNTLLSKILNNAAYKNIDKDVLTKVFRDAQQKALNTCVNKTKDCPINEGPTALFRTGILNIFFTSQTTVDNLVNLTLYYFDRLLYSQIAE